MLLLGYLITCASELAALHCIARAYLPWKALPRAQQIALHLLYAVVTVSQAYFAYAQGLNTAINMVMKLALLGCYVGSIPVKLLIAVAAMVVGVLSECLILIGGRMLTGIDLVDPAVIMTYMPVLCLLSSLVRLLLSAGTIGLIRFYQRHKRRLYLANLFLLAVLVLLAITMLVNFGQTAYLAQSLAVIALLAVTVGICLDMFRDQLKVQREHLRAQFLEEQLTAQLSHYEALYERMQEMHEIRHNVKNILINIDSYLTLGEPDRAHEYIQRYQAEVSAEAVVDNGLPLIDAVLTAKKAGFAGDFRLRIEPLRCEQIDLADVGMLLAVALDNAIEGSAGTGKPYIAVSIVQQAQTVSIRLQNPTNNRPAAGPALPASTKPDAGAHGYGLRSCQRLTEKWHGGLAWSCEDGVFTLDLLLQDLPPATV